MTTGIAYRREGFTEKLDDFALVLGSTVGHLGRRLNKGSDARRALCTSWDLARQWGLVVDQGNAVSFPIWRQGDETTPGQLPSSGLVATLKPCTQPNSKRDWAVAYAGPDSWHILARLQDDAATPRNIYEFAYLPWERILTEVSRRALREPWGFESGDMSILESYLTYTYQRAAIQGKVLVDAGAGLAALNTGLVTPTYDSLYLCFKPNMRNRPDWMYDGVCVAGERGLGKQLVDTFAQLPERAEYIQSVTDLIFDNARELYVDTHHVVVDNVDRLPMGFLRAQMYDRPELVALLDELEAASSPARSDYDRLREGMEKDPELLYRLNNRLDDAVRLARKRTQWNYRTAVPCYYPTANEMSLLLPLCLQNPRVPDAALVVSIAPSGSYQGETVLTMQQAYLDARLICRPENDWLVPN